MTAFKDWQAIDSIFGSFKGATEVTKDMTLAYNALTEKQQGYLKSLLGEESGLYQNLILRAQYTAAVSTCATAEAAELLTKNGLSTAETDLLVEKVRVTLQNKAQAKSVNELTQAELKQIVVEEAAANGINTLDDAGAEMFARFLSGKGSIDGATGSMMTFGNVAKTAGKNLLSFIGSIPGIIAIYSAAVYAAIQIYDRLVLTAEEAKEKSDEIAQEISSNKSEIADVESELEQVRNRLLELNSIEVKSIADEEETKELQAQNTKLQAQLILLRNINAEKEKEQKEADTYTWKQGHEVVYKANGLYTQQSGASENWIKALLARQAEASYANSLRNNSSDTVMDTYEAIAPLSEIDYAYYAADRIRELEEELETYNAVIAKGAELTPQYAQRVKDIYEEIETKKGEISNIASHYLDSTNEDAQQFVAEMTMATASYGERLDFLKNKIAEFGSLKTSELNQWLSSLPDLSIGENAGEVITAFKEVFGTDAWNSLVTLVGDEQEAVYWLEQMQGELRATAVEIQNMTPDERLSAMFEKIGESVDSFQENISSLGGSLENILNEDFDSNDLVDLLQEYPELVEAAADGTDALADAMDDLIDGEIEAMLRQMDELGETYGYTDDQMLYFKVLLEDIGQAAKSSGNLVQSNLINQLTTLTEELEGATRAKTEYDEAMAAGEKGDLFKSYQEAYDTFMDEIDAGHYGSNAFMESAKFLFGYDQLADLDFDPRKIAEWADEYSKAKEVFIDNDETESYGLGLLNALHTMADESGNITDSAGNILASCRIEDGSYIWDVDLTRLDDLGEKMGLTSDAIMATIDALGVWENLDLYSIEEIVSLVETLGLVSEDAASGIKRIDLASFVKALSDAGKSDVEIGRIFSELSEIGGIEFDGTLDQIDDLLSLVVLLQDTTNTSASDLIGILSNLGITLDGSTAQAQAFVDLMFALGATSDEIELLKQRLGEIESVDVSGISSVMENATTKTGEMGDAATIAAEKAGEVSDAAGNASDEMNQVTSEAEGLAGQLDNTAAAAQNATSYVQSTSGAVRDLNRKSLSSVNKQFNTLAAAANNASSAISNVNAAISGSSTDSSDNSGRKEFVQQTRSNRLAKGTQNAKGGVALVNDGNGPELIADGGRAYIANGGAPALVNLSTGAKVYTAEQTEDIFRSRGKENEIPAFAGGSVGSSIPVKLVTSVTSGGGRKSSGSSSGNYSYSNSGSSDDNPFEELIDQFNRSMDGLQFKLDIGEIEESSYYSELKKMLDALVRETGYTIEEILDGITKSGSEIDDSLVSLVRDVYRDIYDYSKDYYESVYSDVLDKYADQLDRVSDAYETLVDAAEEYREQGYLTLETFNDLLELEPAYLGLLSNENGQLVINRESIEKIVQARKEQLAVETALAYVEQLRIAKESNDTQGLKELLKVTDATTDSTWSLVYANLALAGLSDEQYKTALKNINTIRALAGAVSGGLDEATGNVSKSIPDASDALEDILDMTEELIKAENEDMVDALKEQVEQWNKIIETKQEALRVAKEEEDYDKKVSEYAASIAETQAKIIQLSLDDSREAQAEKAELEKQLADYQEELADYQADHAYDAAIDALDREKEAYEEEKNAEIERLELTLSSEQKLYEAAMARLDTGWGQLYDQLIAYNTEYGNRINDDITAAWESARLAVERYGSYAAAVNATTNPSSEDAANTGISAGNTAQWESDAATIGAQAKAEAAAKAEAEKKSAASSNSNTGNTETYPYGKASDTSGNIGWGSQGDNVKAVQYALQKLGYDLGPKGIDGIFGQYTYNAVRSFQSSTGISSDGIVGVNTRAKFKAKGYSLGGLVDYTGPAMVHGSPEKPEAFLNAEETKAVKTIAEELSAPRDGDDVIANWFMKQYGVDVSKFQAMFSMPSGHTPAEQALAAAKDALETAATTINNTRSIGDIHVTVPIQVTERLDKTEIERMSGQISSTVISTIKDGFYRKGTRPGLSLV